MNGRADAAGVVLLRWLARAGLLALWALVGWGTLLLLATAGAAARDGLGPALRRLLPPSHASPWAWLNGLSAALAIAVWLRVAAVLPRRRRSPPLDRPMSE
jgi:hypothetical protein